VWAGFAYDFEGLATGGLTGQDGWTDPSSPEPDWESGNVAYGPAESGNTTLCIQGKVTTNQNQSNQRLFSPVYFTSADTAVEQQLSAYLATAGGTMSLGGAWFHGTHVYQNVFGLDEGAIAYYRTTANQELHGDTLTSGHWYDFKLVMDFSTVGGAAKLYYKDVTAGDPTFIEDSKMGTISMGLTPDEFGRYQVDGLTTRMEGTGSYVDNFSVGTVPEPSTIMLLVTGCLGLLAYAWRKRRS
jgi:hypothetical protein